MSSITFWVERLVAFAKSSGESSPRIQPMRVLLVLGLHVGVELAELGKPVEVRTRQEGEESVQGLAHNSPFDFVPPVGRCRVECPPSAGPGRRWMVLRAL